MLTQLSVSGNAWGVIPGTIIIGLGQALVFTTMFIAGSTGVDSSEQGVSSAVINTGQQIGGAIGLAVIMAIISAALGSDTAMESMSPAALNSSIHTAFMVAAVVTLVGILVAFVALKRANKTSTEDRKVVAGH
ncbi:hypothetical protein [Paenibacillus glycanilyticus]|uniref:hypothetical protein n=1 Tax=Paenibacillus glycanilyticus TaxID=126569 RepID=UPI003EC09ED1